MFTTGKTVDLAEWIIDDILSCFFVLFSSWGNNCQGHKKY